MIQEKGFKGDRARAQQLYTYQQMVKQFRVRNPITAAELARMTNKQLLQANKDLYNGASLKSAKKLAKRLGVLVERPRRGLLARIIKAVFHG